MSIHFYNYPGITKPAGLIALEKLENLFGMRFSLFNGIPLLDHVAFRPDHHSRANRPLHFLAVHHFFAEGAVLFHDFARRVGEQEIRQIELGGKLIMRIKAVLAYAQHDCIGFLKLWIELAEPASFLGSARRAVLRIEKHNHGLAFELVQGMIVPIIARQAERRRLLAFEILHYFPPFAMSIS